MNYSGPCIDGPLRGQVKSKMVTSFYSIVNDGVEGWVPYLPNPVVLYYWDKKINAWRHQP